jgi:chromosome segregation ATPase
MTLTEEQWRIIENIVAIIGGAGSSISIQWLAKKKTKTEAKDTHTENLLKGNESLVDQTQDVAKMLQDLLQSERDHFRVEIERVQTSCNLQISTLKTEYGSRIQNLIADNEDLNQRVSRLSTDNKELNIQVASLTTNNKQLNSRIVDLKNRLGKYENDLNDTGDHKSIKL